jgi:hypothetical protein
MLELNKIDSKLFALNVTQLSDGTSVSLLETATGLIAIGVGIEPKTDSMQVLEVHSGQRGFAENYGLIP